MAVNLGLGRLPFTFCHLTVTTGSTCVGSAARLEPGDPGAGCAAELVAAVDAGTDEDLGWCWARQAGRLGDEGVANWVRHPVTVRPARSPEPADCRRLRTVGRTCVQSLADGWIAVAELCPSCTRRFMDALDAGTDEELRWSLAFRRTARRRTR